MVVAALALDRFGDEAGDVVRMRLERGSRRRQGFQLRRIDVGRAVDRRRRDARPVELREARDLVRVGVGQRHRVAGASVERVLQMKHPRAQ